MSEIKKVVAHFPFNFNAVSFQFDGNCFLGKRIYSKAFPQDEKLSDEQIAEVIKEQRAGGEFLATHYAIDLSSTLDKWFLHFFQAICIVNDVDRLGGEFSLEATT